MTSLVSAVTAVAALIFTGLSLDNARRQGDVAEQGQFTDRFTKAVEQLGQTGDEHLHLRIGGLYALARLARDSPADQPAIVEVLVAFVRTSVPRHDPDRPQCPDLSPTADVRTALTVLGRRDPAHDGGSVVNLRSLCLNVAEFRDAQLAGADLRDASLRVADFSGANLRDAQLSGADLFAAFAVGTDFRGAHFEAAVLNGMTVKSADFRGAAHNETTKAEWATTDSATQGAWW